MTLIISLALLRFAVACAGSLIIAFALGALLRQAGKRWPALFVHRSVWLLAQATVVVAFAVASFPLPRSVIAPTLTVPAISAPALPGAALEGDAVDATAYDTDRHLVAHATDADGAGEQVLIWLPATWFGIYCAGLAWTVARRCHSGRQWQRLLSQTRPVDASELRSLTADQLRRIVAARIAVRTVDAPVSPMLIGLFRPYLLLPSHVFALDVGQQLLIVEHELTHWRRADGLWLALSDALGMLFWFNRPYQRLKTTTREAVELGCDDTVLATRGAQERQHYAAALVAQMRLQLQCRQGHGAPAFGPLGVEQRILRMRQARPARLSARYRVLVTSAFVSLAGALVLMTPAISSASLPEPVLASVTAPIADQPRMTDAWRYPLDQVSVTALYGVRSPSVPAGHNGVDLAARRGTPVRAVAAGLVVESAFNPVWGNYVRVDHGGGVSSLVMHLERSSVAYGAQVAAGDMLGTVGDSGKATGAHLHLEYWKDGRRLDPALILSDLNNHATPRALARRKSQTTLPASDS